MKAGRILFVTLLSIFGCVLLAVAYVFRENLAPLQRRTLETPNPTSHVFQMPLEVLRDKLLAAFSIEQQIRNRKVFAFKNRVGTYPPREISLKPETKETALFGKTIFEKDENRNDIFLHAFGEPILSRTYFAFGKALGYHATFHIHLESLQSGETKVSINVVRPTVVKGIGGIGPHGFYSQDVAVPPTTIEECELLRYFGYVLGDENMPSVSYPK